MRSSNGAGPPRYLIFVDVETTGLRPEAGAEIVAVGAVRVSLPDWTVVDEFVCWVHPRRPELADPAARAINGYSRGRWEERGAVRVEDARHRLRPLLEGAELCGHKKRFDEKFLRTWYAKGDRPWGRRGICTLGLMRSRVISGEHEGSCSLPASCAALGVPLERPHDPLCDAWASMEIARRTLCPAFRDLVEALHTLRRP